MATSTENPAKADEAKKAAEAAALVTEAQTETSNTDPANPVAVVSYEDGVPRLADGSIELLPTSAEGGTSDGVVYAVSDADPDKIPTTKKELDALGYVVRYKGMLALIEDGRRIITDEEWAKAGVANQKSVAWVKGNGFTVPTSDLSAAALAYCRDIDPGLVLEPA